MIKQQKGFTIIELLIATTVFSVVLLIVSAAIIGLGRQYYKGVNQSKTQEVARSIVEEIANNLKYSTGDPINLGTNGDDISGWCISERLYAFRVGEQLGTDSNQSRAVLLRGDDCNLPDEGNFLPGPNQTELIGENMRLSRLTIEEDANNVWTVTVRVAMGTDEDLDDPNGPNAVCKGQENTQFCSVSEYQSRVVKRIN